MNPEIALCRHLASPSITALRIEPDDVLEWDDGPVVGVARCAVCDAAALLELLDWSATRQVRVFALAGFDAAAIELFRRNRERGSCDLQRQAREFEALLFSAGPVERLIALDVESRSVVASVPRPAALRLPSRPWRERIPAPNDLAWFARLGLDKTQAS